MKIPEYLWKQVAGELINRLRNGKSGDRFLSLREVCREYQVSLITAKRIFMELERSGYIRMAQGKGTFVVKRPAGLTINLVLPGNMSLENHTVSLSFFFALMRGITAAAAEIGATLNACTAFTGMRGWKNSCLIILDPLALDGDLLKQIARNNYVILYGHGPDEVSSTICLDIKKGIYLATRHLLSLGHRRIGLITGVISRPWQTLRFEGHLKALRGAGVKLDWCLVKELIATGRNELDDAMRQLLALRNGPTAVVATTDLWALQILDYCRNNGVQVPQELSVTGFDNISEAEQSDPPLTTVDAQYYRIGQKAVEQVVNMARSGKHAREDIVMAPTLVERGTTLLKLPAK